MPQQEEATIVVENYLRDRAYEESQPIGSHFRFKPENRELLMTTPYNRVVSVNPPTH